MLSGAGNQNGEKTTMGLVQEGGATLLFSNYVYSLMLNLTKRLETKISELHARANVYLPIREILVITSPYARPY